MVVVAGETAYGFPVYAGDIQLYTYPPGFPPVADAANEVPWPVQMVTAGITSMLIAAGCVNVTVTASVQPAESVTVQT